MRIGYLSSRMLVIINVIGTVLCLSTTVWIYVTHTDLTPEKNERLFTKNLEDANKISDLDIFRQVHQSMLITHRRERDHHFTNVQPIVWMTSLSIVLFVFNGFIFVQLVKNRSIRIR